LIIDSSHKRWVAATVVATLGATAAYVVYAVRAPEGPTGGSWPGLAFGVAGSALMVFAGLLSARKQVPTWRVGRASTWLRGHIWLGLLSLPLIAFHSGFRWGGTLEVVLWVVFLAIVTSGVFGLALQQFLTRMISTSVPLETIYEEIPHICQVLCDECDSLVTAKCGPLDGTAAAESPSDKKVKGKKGEFVAGSEPLKDFYLHEVRPLFSERFPRSARLADPSQASAAFAQVRAVVPASLHETVDQLVAHCDERRQIALQLRLHHWLHGWLLVHVPLSAALLVLGVAHAVVALWY
jgi:hypothetical protein